MREKRVTKNRHDVDCSHGLCTFPNMVSNANIVRKSGKKREENSQNVDCCLQCWGTVYMVCAHFQIW